VILTAPKPTDFDLRGGALPRWRIERRESSGRFDAPPPEALPLSVPAPQTPSTQRA
jgi:hypothetical protein